MSYILSGIDANGKYKTVTKSYYLRDLDKITGDTRNASELNEKLNKNFTEYVIAKVDPFTTGIPVIYFDESKIIEIGNNKSDYVNASNEAYLKILRDFMSRLKEKEFYNYVTKSSFINNTQRGSIEILKDTSLPFRERREAEDRLIEASLTYNAFRQIAHLLLTYDKKVKSKSEQIAQLEKMRETLTNEEYDPDETAFLDDDELDLLNGTEKGHRNDINPHR